MHTYILILSSYPCLPILSGLHLFHVSNLSFLHYRSSNSCEKLHRWAMGWTVEKSRFDSQQGQVISPFSTSSTPSLGLTQPPSTQEVKRLGRETDRSLPSSAKVTNAWSLLSLPHTS
jgi:hypothetical protein